MSTNFLLLLTGWNPHSWCLSTIMTGASSFFSVPLLLYLICSVLSDSFVTLWTRVLGPLVSSVHGASQQEYWSGLPFPPPGDPPDPGIELASPSLGGGFFTTVLPGKPPSYTWPQPKGPEVTPYSASSLRLPPHHHDLLTILQGHWVGL